MTTALDIIKSAARKIHVLGVGQTLEAAIAEDGRALLNSMLASWSAEGDLIFAETTEIFTLTGAESYTIGTGGTFNTTTPKRIISAEYIRDGYDYDLEQKGPKWYAGVKDKDLTGSAGYFVYDFNHPLGNIYIWPIGYSGDQLRLVSEKPLTSFASLSTDFDMPGEYRAALENNLAVWWGPEFEREASQTVKEIAEKTKNTIIAQNTQNNDYTMEVDSVPTSSGHSFNIYQGY